MRLWLFPSIVLVVACSGNAPAADGGSETSASTVSSTSGGGCPIGTQGCVCTGGGACDPGLECVAGYCVDPDCAVGTQGCPCTGGGACDPGLVCNSGFCVDDGGGTSVGTSGMTSVDSTASATSDASMSQTGPSDTSVGDTSVGDTSVGDTSVGDTGGMVDLDDWTKRRPILVDNSLSVALVDHEVLVVIPWDADWEPTLDDLRFTNTAGTTLLPHWVESFTGGVDVDVWVRVPQVGANDVATIYVWYGNAAAADASDPEATFHYWESFDGNDIDGGWLATGDYAVANGRLTVNTGSVYSLAPLATLPDSTIEVRARWSDETGSSTGLAIGEAQTQTADTYFASIVRSQNNMEATALDGDFFLVANTLLNGVTLNTWAWVGVGANDDYIQFLTSHGLDDDNTMAGVAGDFYVILGWSAGSLAGTTDVQSVDYDSVLVRKFALTVPETFVLGEEDV